MQVFWIDVDLVWERLERCVATLTRNPHVMKVVLFGSFAQGRAVPGSDLDILIVLDEDKRRIIDRIPAFLEAFDSIGLSVDLFPYTSDELSNPLAERALASGMVLFER